MAGIFFRFWLVLAFCIASSETGKAQGGSPGDLLWVQSSLSSGTGTAESRALATDTTGNSYVVGRFLGTVNFFGTILNSTSSSLPSGFLAKFDKDGSLVFVKKIGSNAWTELLAIAVKPSGEIYVGGNVAGTFSSGSVNFVVSSSNGQNALLLRLDADGNPVWGMNYGGTGNDSIQVMTLTRESHVAFGGNFISSINLDTTSFATYGSQDIFVARCDDSNQLYDIRRIGGTNSDVFRSLDIDGQNDMILGVSFNGNIELGPTVGQVPLTAAPISFVVAKYSKSNTQPIWHRSFSSSTSLTLQKAVTNTASDSVVFAGQYTSAMNFGGITPLTSPNAAAGFIVMLDKNGNFLWQKSIGGESSFDFVWNVSTSPSGVLGATGRIASIAADSSCAAISTNGIQQTVYMAMLTDTGGCLWNQLAVGTGVGFGQYVTATAESDFVYAGYSGSGDFGSGPIPSGSSNREAFVVRYRGFNDFSLAAPTTYAQWKQAHFNVDELADPSTSGDLADPDKDGVQNLLEYGLNIDPKAAGVTGVRVQIVDGKANILHQKNSYATDLELEIETSENLVHWQAASLSIGSYPRVAGITDVTAIDNAELSNVPKFYRLKATVGGAASASAPLAMRSMDASAAEADGDADSPTEAVRLAVKVDQSGQIEVDGRIIGDSRELVLDAASTHRFTARPAKHYVFDGWEGLCEGVGDASCEAIVKPGSFLKAKFRLVQTAPDKAPEDFQVRQSAGRVFLSWRPQEADAAVQVERRMGDNEEFVPITSLPWNMAEEEFEDMDVLPEQTYQYRIRACNLAGQGPLSPVRTVTTDALTPHSGP